MSTALAWSAGCSQGQLLKVGIHPWVGYESLELAQQFKWLPEGVELVHKEELNTSGAALQAGQVDAACLTLDEVLRLRAEGTPVTVGLVFDVSAGADALLVRPGIERLACPENALAWSRAHWGPWCWEVHWLRRVWRDHPFA